MSKLKLKFAIVGDKGVGKTSFINSCVNGGFFEHPETTSKFQYYDCNELFNGKKTEFIFLDTVSSQDKTGEFTEYLHDCVSGILIIDITNRDTLSTISKWITLVGKNLKIPTGVFVIGSKLDMAKNRQFSSNEVSNILNKHNCKYLEMSFRDEKVMEHPILKDFFMRIISVCSEFKNDQLSFPEYAKRLEVDLSLFKQEQGLSSRLGVGGFAEVVKATDTRTCQPVAIKIITTDHLSKNDLDIYRREVIIMSHIDCIFLVKIIGFTVTNPFSIIMEYVPNGSLFSHLHRGPPPQWLTTTRRNIIAMGIAYGMANMHENTIIHRDLKSANILIDDKYFPKICDFGVSKFENHMDSNKERVGTLQWMAPEMLSNSRYDSKIDVYSYSMILFELITNQIPFSGVPPFNIYNQVVQLERRPLLPPTTPTPLRNLVYQSWGTDPTMRPTFREIYNLFATHQVEFPQVDRNEIDKFIQIINENEAKRKLNENRYASSPNFSNGANHLSPAKKEIKPKRLKPNSKFNRTSIFEDYQKIRDSSLNKTFQARDAIEAFGLSNQRKIEKIEFSPIKNQASKESHSNNVKQYENDILNSPQLNISKKSNLKRRKTADVSTLNDNLFDSPQPNKTNNSKQKNHKISDVTITNAEPLNSPRSKGNDIPNFKRHSTADESAFNNDSSQQNEFRMHKLKHRKTLDVSTFDKSLSYSPQPKEISHSKHKNIDELISNENSLIPLQSQRSEINDQKHHGSDHSILNPLQQNQFGTPDSKHHRNRKESNLNKSLLNNSKTKENEIHNLKRRKTADVSIFHHDLLDSSQLNETNKPKSKKHKNSKSSAYSDDSYSSLQSFEYSCHGVTIVYSSPNIDESTLERENINVNPKQLPSDNQASLAHTNQNTKRNNTKEKKSPDYENGFNNQTVTKIDNYKVQKNQINEKINIDEDQNISYKELSDKNELSNKKQCKSSPSLNTKKSHKPMKANIYFDINSISKADFRLIRKSLTRRNIASFFNYIIPFLDDGHLIYSLQLVLINLKKIICDDYFFKSFIQSDIMLHLPFTIDELTDVSIQIVAIAIDKDPNCIDSRFTQAFKYLFAKAPEKIIDIMITYAGYFNNIKNPWILLDLLLTHSKEFIKSSEAIDKYINLFYNLCKHFPEYREERLIQCFHQIMKLLPFLENKSAIHAYKFFNGFYDENFFLSKFPNKATIDYETINRHLSQKELAKYALNFLNIINNINCKDSILYDIMMSLLYITKNNQEFSDNEKKIDPKNRNFIGFCYRILFKLLNTNNGREVILQDLSFLKHKLPTYKDTFKIYKELSKYPKINSKINETQINTTLFLKYLNERREKAISPLLECFNNIDLSAEIIVSLYQNGFSNTLYEICKSKTDVDIANEESKNSKIIFEILEIFQDMACYIYIPTYRKMIDFIIGNYPYYVSYEMRKQNLNVLAQFSCHPKCVSYLKKNDISFLYSGKRFTKQKEYIISKLEVFSEK